MKRVYRLMFAAQAFVREGAQVVVGGRNADSCATTERDPGGNGLAISGDAADPQTAIRAIQLCQTSLGGFDGLYHVAGRSGRRFGDRPLHELTLEGWNATLSLNLTSLMLSSQAAIRAFREAGTGGTILNMRSVLGQSPSPKYFVTHAYAAANIRINSLVPALIASSPVAQRATSDEAISAGTKTKQPLGGGRIGKATDLDGAAIYFMSDQSVFTTGQTLTVDGGWSVSEGQY